ncbi:MAG: hypothetical protein N3A69_07165 [Leptospiraceae bacterium]|nr:hypothetical protein [Leptospiraceae bacterium]
MKIFLLILSFNITVIYSEPSQIGFIYINANSGQSSGGHSAFLIGETVYHFQLFSDGIFHLVREPFESFRTVYGEIENRSIWIHILELDQKKAEQVQEFWNLAYIEQQVELRELENLENYLFLLNQIISNGNFASYSTDLKLQSLGYFTPESPNKQTYQFIQKSFPKLKLEKQLKDWKNSITNNHLDSLEKSNLLLNSIYHIHALENIMNRNGLQEESYFEIPSSVFQFDTSLYFQRLKEYQFILEQNILDILKNPSLWNGRALVMSLARWCVIQRSIQEKKFYFLDSFSDTYSYLPYKKLISSKTFHIM